MKLKKVFKNVSDLKQQELVAVSFNFLKEYIPSQVG